MEEGWAKPNPYMQKYHYYRNGKSLCGVYYYKGNNFFSDIPKEKCCAICFRTLHHPEIYRLAKTLYARKVRKLFKVLDKYGDHLQYPLKRHVEHLMEEFSEFLLAYLSNDKEKMIEELIDISNMCDLTYDKIRRTSECGLDTSYSTS